MTKGWLRSSNSSAHRGCRRNANLMSTIGATLVYAATLSDTRAALSGPTHSGDSELFASPYLSVCLALLSAKVVVEPLLFAFHWPEEWRRKAEIY